MTNAADDSGSRLRILFLTPFPPRSDGSHGGSRVAAQLISRLALRHRVALLALRKEGDPPADELLIERCERYEEVRRPLVGRSFAELWKQRQRLPLVLARAPAWVTGCSVADYEARLRALSRDWKPDVVQLEYAVMGQYSRALDGTPARRVLVEYDPGEGPPTGSWARFRKSVMRRVDSVVVFTPRDERAVRPLARVTPVARIPIGVELPSSPLDPLGRPPPTLLFVGNYLHPPNVEAALRLGEQILPRVRARHPDAVACLVGERPPPALSDGKPGVLVTGRVNEVAPYLEDAAVVVAPLRSGGGMRVKVLEALAAGKAVVASPLAVAGLDVVDGEHVLLAESDDDFAAAIAGILDDPEGRSRLARNARAWAVEHLEWDAVVRAYEELYARLLEAPAP